MEVSKKNSASLWLVFAILLGHSCCMAKGKDKEEQDEVEYQGVAGIGLSKVAKSVDKVCTSADGLKAELPNVGINTAKTVINATKDGVLLGSMAFVCWKAKQYFYPSNEEKIRELESSRKVKILFAEDELCQSLALHASEKRNSSGIPCVCEDAAKSYAAVAGFDALSKKTEEFKRATTQSFWQKYSAFVR